MKVVVLCYHKVGTEAAEGRRLNIHPDRLDSHIRFFKRRSFRFLKAKELADWPSNPSVCFTFDDAYVSTIDNGAPVFDRHQVPMTIYAVSDWVGESSEWDGDQARPIATWDALRDLQSRGHEIGNHTASHPHLNQLPINVQAAEIAVCQGEMKEQGLRSESFCYPYGHLNDESVQALSLLEYKVGMALGKRPATEKDHRLKLPRIVVAYGDALPLLLYKLHLRQKLK